MNVIKKCVNGQYVEMTEEEILICEHERKTFEAQEKHRPLTLDEVNSMLIKKQINMVDISDETAVRMLDFYPTFSEVVGQTVEQGFKFTYKGKLFKVIQASITISEVYPPETGTESLYARIDEVHDGDIYDPIPYEGNMALENGKYYVQNNITYLCNRDTGNPVHNALSELIGLYVEVIGGEV
jgi:hypothetical protein